ETTVVALVAAQVARTPDAVAVVAGDTHLSYAGLQARAQALATRLRAAGVGPDDVVGVAVPHGLALPIAVLAVWQAGGAVLPLDLTWPAARLTALQRAAAPLVVVRTADGAGADFALVPSSRPP